MAFDMKGTIVNESYRTELRIKEILLLSVWENPDFYRSIQSKKPYLFNINKVQQTTEKRKDISKAALTVINLILSP